MKYPKFSPALSRNVLRVFFLGSIMFLFAIQVTDYLNFGVDDVFISMRVAENAANGHGFVYNIGENVEGYSNPLWVAFLTVGARLGFNSSHSQFALLWFAKGMSFAFGIGVLILLFFIAKNFEEDPEAPVPLRFLVLLVAVSCGPFVLWCCGGLESTMAAFFFTLSVFLFLKIRKKHSSAEAAPLSLCFFFSVVLGLAALVRPEPVLHGVAALAFVIAAFGRRMRRSEIFSLLLPFAVIFSAFLLWRYITYGDLLPNTFYAKTGGGLKSYGLSIKYLLGGVCMIGGTLMLAGFFAFSRRGEPVFTYCIVLITVTLIFILYSGGDWMAGYRFFIPVAPVFFLLIAVGIARMMTILRTNTIFGPAGILRLFSFIVFLSYSSAFAGRILIRGQIQTMPTGFSEQTGHSTPWHVEVGNWIRAHSEKPPVVATGEAGMIGYLNMDMRLIDLLGLMDKHIAYERKHSLGADANYVLDQKPDYILLAGNDAQSVIVANSRPGGDYFGAIGGSRRFHEEYHLEKSFISLSLYARNK